VNVLFDRTQRPHMTGHDLSALTGVRKSTLANKAKPIHDVLRIGQFDPDFCRRELLAANPIARMISVNGFIVDARTMPPEVQAEARRRGLILDLPADRIGAGRESHEGREAQGSEGGEPKDDDTPAMGLAEAVREVIDILRGQPASGSEGADGWDRIVRTVAEHESLPESEVKAIERAMRRRSTAGRTRSAARSGTRPTAA
jgi:hypothetical protein